ncbi:hypothetical protein H2198_001127 [Neophaeococcomyces mojaviensis]|uniref:Uncharacterized protein n=1 Tax=Neophaeococcomyces mojaviensis TaxID=3383035 RepID=A0ACC3AIT6_9EURO|nr:hypothetical protein H2198_001127 [Knufia sp. JES_112]
MDTINPNKPLLLTASAPEAETIIEGIAHLHAHCILHDHTLATFLPPLSFAKMTSYWSDRLSQVSTGHRHIIVQLLPISTRTANTPPSVFTADSETSASAPEIDIGGEKFEVAGVVSLHKPESETGPFRGEVEKLFTSPNHRRKGVARTIMRELEMVAVRDDRWSLLLDTTVGTEAENVYPRLGYTRMGVVKAYGISPEDGQLVDEVWFWKDLRSSEPI